MSAQSKLNLIVLILTPYRDNNSIFVIIDRFENALSINQNQDEYTCFKYMSFTNNKTIFPLLLFVIFCVFFNLLNVSIGFFQKILITKVL